MTMSAPLEISSNDAINICQWEDATTEQFGFDPRSHYAELFWLPILGPSTMWLLRNLAQRFDTEPDGFQLDINEASRAIGIGSKGGRSSSFNRTITRIVNFGMGRQVDSATIAVRRILPSLHAGQLRRLSPTARRLHHHLLEERTARSGEDHTRATQVALTLLHLGDSPDIVEQQLVVWGVQPGLARPAVDEAWASKARSDTRQAEDELTHLMDA